MRYINLRLTYLLTYLQGHDIIQRQKTGKRYKIELYLQWPTNRSRVWFIEQRHFQ